MKTIISQEPDLLGKLYLPNKEYVNTNKPYYIAYEARLEKMMGIKDVLAKNLKINRLRLGLTQEQLAEKADISPHYFAMIELAKKFPSASMLERIAKALEIEPHELFYMPSTAENALKCLQVTVTSDIKKIVDHAIERILSVETKN